MKTAISIGLSLLAACVTVENNTAGSSELLGAGANNGTGNPTSCRAACQNIASSCGQIVDPRSNVSYSVDECTSQCIQVAPPPATVSCVATAPSCGAIEDCVGDGGGSTGDGGTGSGGGTSTMGTCGGMCGRLAVCGDLMSPETGEPISHAECEQICIEYMIPQFTLDCVVNTQTCSGLVNCQ